MRKQNKLKVLFNYFTFQFLRLLLKTTFKLLFDSIQIEIIKFKIITVLVESVRENLA